MTRVSTGHARVVSTVTEALEGIAAGMTVGIGGALNTGHPMALVRGLIQKRLTDLVLVAGFGSFNLDLLVGAGTARRLIAAFVGAEGVNGLPPMIRWMHEQGRLEAWDVDEGLLLVALKAAAQHLPYATWRGGLGTDIGNSPLVRLARDDETALPYLKVRPLPLDAVIYWAEAADTDGNVRRWGPDFGDTALIEAAALRIVQVERIVPTGTLSADPERVAPWQADVVLCAPMGTYPFASNLLSDDLEWLQAYMVQMEALRRAGDPTKVDQALADLLCLGGDDDAFLARAGLSRLRRLMA